jgi:putative transposase
MTSKPVALLLADPGITKTHARPHVSNDNPFWEEHFRRSSTARHSPSGSARSRMPGRLPRLLPLVHAEHHHVGLGLLTPADVHRGLAEQRVATRATLLATAYAAHPERFPAGLPRQPEPPVEVWINRPKTQTIEGASHTPILAGSASLDPLKASRYARSTLGAAGNCRAAAGSSGR